MKFIVHIECDNSAFDVDGEPYYEVGRILSALVADHLNVNAPTIPGAGVTLFDRNGNRVGNARFSLTPFDARLREEEKRRRRKG